MTAPRTNTIGVFKSGYVNGCYANETTDEPILITGITGFNTTGYKPTLIADDGSYVLLSRNSFMRKGE